MKRCQYDLRRACASDTDCPGVCAGDVDIECNIGTSCGGEGGDCTYTGPCVEHPDVGRLRWWVDTPEQRSCDPLADCTGQSFSALRDYPVFRTWTDDVIHITGCEIVPVATYELRSTVDGFVFTYPLRIGTIRKPNVDYGDSVGPPDWGERVFAEPDGHTNIIDISAYLLAKQDHPSAPHTTWVDMHASTNPVVPQQIINVGDLSTIKFGFMGQLYVQTPGQLAPGDCP